MKAYRGLLIIQLVRNFRTKLKFLLAGHCFGTLQPDLKVDWSKPKGCFCLTIEGVVSIVVIVRDSQNTVARGHGSAVNQKDTRWCDPKIAGIFFRFCCRKPFTLV